MQIKAIGPEHVKLTAMTTSAPFTELDVRPLFAGGRPPLPAILEAVNALPAGHALRLLAPMEPVPLYSLLGNQGFTPEARPLEGGDWEIWFRPTTPTELDLRELPPPEPMQRALEAVAALPDGASLTILTRFRPVHLLEHLAPRGYEGISEEQSDKSWRTVIHPATTATRANP